MTQPVVVIGGGGWGRCVLDVIEAINRASGDHPELEVVGVLDDGTPDYDLLAARDVDILGPVSHLEELAADVGYVIAIAAGATRRKIDEYGDGMGRSSPRLVHPSVHRGHDVTVGPGSIIGSHVSIETNVWLGRHVHVNSNAVIGHDSQLGDYVSVGALAAVADNVDIAHSVLLGTGCTVNPGLHLHKHASVGPGAVVTRDVMGRATVSGVPARPA